MTAMKAQYIFVAVLACRTWSAPAQLLPRSDQLADAAMLRWPAAGKANPSNDDFDLLLAALDEEWLGTADAKYFRYVESAVAPLIAPDGAIQGYDKESSNLDDIALGRELLLLYRVTQQKKYFDAAANLRIQLISQPRNRDGGYSHGNSYPGQMWVEDLYDAEPFNAEFAAVFQQPQNFTDITRQFVLFEQHARDPETGLLNERVDEAGKRISPHQSKSIELRATADYMTALVDTLPYYPQTNGGRATLLALLRQDADAAEHYSGERGGISADARNAQNGAGDPKRTATLSMFVYALAKAVRLGYLDESYFAAADRAFRQVTGLHDYAELASDPATAGDIILANREMEVALLTRLGRGDKAVLDAWFNSQKRFDALDQSEYFHYKWQDYSDSGFSIFRHLFNDYGIGTDTLYEAPNAFNLSSTQFYIIVSPDIPAKNPKPHYVTERDAEEVAAWVRQGGILLMMENDPANADIEHLDLLADRFGIHFNDVLSHHVIGDTFAMGRIDAPGGSELFASPRVLYMKDTCSITVSGGAKPLLIDKGDIMMAAVKYGKGTVFAVVDPWLYNEYTDGRKLPADYGNFQGAQDLLQWLIRQLPSRGSKPVR
ncbi:MAG: glycoside hydrolase family 88 protein [Terracidiphilus sp.]